MLTIHTIYQFDGPNWLSAQPGVWALLHADRDRRKWLHAGIKDVAQQMGLVIAGLQVETAPLAEGVHLQLQFQTPTPALGVAMVDYLVAGFQAQATGDTAWDAEGRLWELQQRRRAEAPPVRVLQLVAEAERRGIPAFLQRSSLQLGTGQRGWSIAWEALRERRSSLITPDEIQLGVPPFALAEVEVPWERLGAIPLVAVVAAGAERERAMATAAAWLAQQGLNASMADGCTFATTREVLSDPTVEAAVLGLDLVDLVQRGAGFDRCVACWITSLPPQTAAGLDYQQMVQGLGVPLLLTEPAGHAVLQLHDPAIRWLQQFAPCDVMTWE